MYHTVNFLDAKSIEQFAKKFGVTVTSEHAVTARHHQVVDGRDVFGMSLACATFQSECRIGRHLGVTDAGGNAIETLSKADKERFGIQAASLNQ